MLRRHKPAPGPDPQPDPQPDPPTDPPALAEAADPPAPEPVALRGVALDADATVAVPSPEGFRQVSARAVLLAGDHVVVSTAIRGELPLGSLAVITMALPTGRACLLGRLDAVGGDRRTIEFVETANDLVLTFLAPTRD